MPERRRVPVPVSKRRVSRPTFSAPPPAAASEPLVDEPADSCACPRLDPTDWHEVESDWADIAFLTTTLMAAAGVPLGYPAAREALLARAAAVGATVPPDAMILLGAGKFRRPVMLEIEDVPDGLNGVERPGGVVFTRLVPASLGALRKALNETVTMAGARYGRKPDDTWMWYLTCRHCSAARAYETLVVAHYRP